MGLSLLAGLGDFAGGLSSAVPQGFQVGEAYQGNQALSTFGAGLRNLVGGQQGGQGAAPPQSFQPPPPTQTAPPPSPSPNLFASGAPAAPMSSPSTPAAGMGPRVAQPSSTLFGQGGVPPQQGAPQMAQPAPTQQPPPPPPQPMQQPPQQGQPQPQIGGGQGQQQGYLTLPQLIQGMIRANPKVSDYQIGLAASKFGLPLLNEQGLQQYRALEGQLRAAGLGLGYDKLAQQAQQFGEREDRIKKNEAANRDFHGGLAGYGTQIKAIQDKIAARRSQFDKDAAAINSDFNLTADDKMKKLQALREGFNKDVDDLTKQMTETKLPEAPKEDTGDGGGEPDAPPSIIYDKNGKAFKYKGSGPRDDWSSYGPISSNFSGMTALVGNTWYSREQLSKGGLQRLIDNAEGDEDLGKIVHSLQTHGAIIPQALRGVEPIAPVQ